MNKKITKTSSGNSRTINSAPLFSRRTQKMSQNSETSKKTRTSKKQQTKKAIDFISGHEKRMEVADRLRKAAKETKLVC